MTWNYQQVEDILAKAFDIREEDRKKFRARLRHFRNVGIPDVTQPGTGRLVEFSREDLAELTLALLLMKGGIAPVHIHYIIESSRKRLHTCSKPAAHREELYVAFMSTEFGGVTGEERPALGAYWGTWDWLSEKLRRALDTPVMRIGAVMNLSVCLNHVFELASPAE